MTIGLLAALVGCGTTSGANGDFAGSIDIGNGRQLYLECHGKGSPTVILESGYHNSSDPWSYSDAAAPAVGPAVLPALAGDQRVCAYDRPGTLRYPEPPSISDRSSPAPMPRTAHDVVDDLHALLAAARVPGPYILVGHSLGGVFARLYAQTHPDEVRAVVFVDAFAVEIPSLMGSDWPTYRQLLDEPLPQFADSPSFEVIDIDKSVAQVDRSSAVPARPHGRAVEDRAVRDSRDCPAGARRETRTGMAARHVGPHRAAAANAARRRHRQRPLRPDSPTRCGRGSRRFGDAEVCAEALRCPIGIIR